MKHIPKIISITYNLAKKVPTHFIVAKYITLKESSNQYESKCPFCRTSESNLTINQKNSFKCGYCGQDGRDAVDFVMQYEKVDKLEAITIVCGFANILPPILKVPKLQFRKVEDLPVLSDFFTDEENEAILELWVENNFNDAKYCK
ncbi:MAG: CHC2 zinc finger domain-containing protein [Sediminibacterium sp.]|nr:CHC2 zinc finger domain-containing protein [Sediminibacterium sp.]